MDLVSLFHRRVFGVVPLDYALVGRWMGHWAEGRGIEGTILTMPPIRNEAVLGWVAHYAIGLAPGLGYMLAVPWGPVDGGAAHALASLGFGLVSVALPWLVMQPAFGFGFAAAKLPRPGYARRQSLIAHGSFGLGLYLVSALLIRFVWRRDKAGAVQQVRVTFDKIRSTVSSAGAAGDQGHGAPGQRGVKLVRHTGAFGEPTQRSAVNFGGLRQIVLPQQGKADKHMGAMIKVGGVHAILQKPVQQSGLVGHLPSVPWLSAAVRSRSCT